MMKEHAFHRMTTFWNAEPCWFTISLSTIHLLLFDI